ncbi:MAG: hypothetical protein ACI4FZ_10780 [Lachnospiraceae bacterium]
MKNMKKSVIAMLLVVCMMFGAAACGGKTTPDTDNQGGSTTETPAPTNAETQTPDNGKQDTQQPEATKAPEPTEGPKEIVTIKYGTHWVQGLDPHYTDEVTGEFVMAADQREARYAAEQAILDELGVVFEYVQYPSDTREALLQSVMANDPICDLAVIWGGAEANILSQNVLQKIDDYASIFLDNEEYSWMLYDKLYGHYYMVSDVVRFNQRWPLVYNIDLVEAVDSLKDENGNTIYPNTLFDEGKWTWSTFKDYLAKIEAYYANDAGVATYNTDTRFAALSAAYSAGGAIYGADGLAVNGQGMKDAVAYIKDLMDAKLLTVTGVYDDGYTPEWCAAGERFVYGKDGVFTVFTDIPDWYINWAATEASNRGQSIGIVPWPRPDSMALDDENYRQVITLGDSVGVLKGVSPEKAELALKAYALYYKVYYTTLAGVDTIAEYQEAYGTNTAASLGFDIFHEQVGDSILNSFLYITSQMPNGKDYSDMLGFRGTWDEILGKSLFGIGGTASYDVAIEANMNKFSEKVSEMEAILSTEGIHDNVAPSVNFVKEPIAVPAGTKMTDPVWMEFLSATDNAEGVLDQSYFKPEFNSPDTDSKVDRAYSEADFQNVGYYYRAFKAYFVDTAGNKGYKTVSVYVYDPNNTDAPVLTASETPVSVVLNSDVNSITWVGDNCAITSAVDADGLDISQNVTVDLSTLDASTPGTYDVRITVTDFAGNTAETTVQVVVE